MAATTPRPPIGDDYDPKQVIQELSANIYQPDKFAEIFCAAARKQKDIDLVLKEIMKELLKKDSDTKDTIKQIIRDVNKEDWKAFLKKIGFWLWSLILIALTALITAWITFSVSGKNP